METQSSSSSSVSGGKVSSLEHPKVRVSHTHPTDLSCVTEVHLYDEIKSVSEAIDEQGVHLPSRTA